ncbi:MAG: glycosyltransferase family 4 protein [Pseudomonadota bacterium]
MNVWLITVGEPLPRLSSDSRLWRVGLLAQELAARGHAVTWWTSRVDHFNKRFFDWTERDFPVMPGLTIRFLDGILYRRNVGMARLFNHWQVAREFERLAVAAPVPAVILSSFPTIELSAAAVQYGKEHGIPVVLDVRDLWPDIFVQAVPGPLRGFLRMVLHGYFASTRRALAGAASLIAVSRGYLQWGIDRAGRAARAEDRVFPLAYSLPGRTDAARNAGREWLANYGVNDASVVCLFAGTLGRTYDLAPVLDAARAFAAVNGSPFRFVICGDGERAAEWREKARGLSNVAFTGWLDQARMRDALMGADIGLAAYAHAAPQGLPNKVIEYMAAGLPVVSSLAGETADLLKRGDCGVSYAAGDDEALRDALERLAAPQPRARLAHNARHGFEAEFVAETIYPQLASYLERAANANSRP